MKPFLPALGFALAVGVVAPATESSATTVINPVEDVMTSAFFFPPDSVRGFAGDNRSVFRVSSDLAFGVGPETIYINFDANDFTGLATPVTSAILTMQSVDGLFNANASVSDPFIVSAHAVSADPITSITDDTNLLGPISAPDFFANNILAADPAALTT
ncbi:MAG: hypothetical protein AAGH92_00215, partial [Planctomycetota bacterium]